MEAAQNGTLEVEGVTPVKSPLQLRYPVAVFVSTGANRKTMDNNLTWRTASKYFFRK